MARVIVDRVDRQRDSDDLDKPSYQAYRILYAGFIAAPVIAGLDKFFNLLTHWDKYLAPQVASLAERTPFSGPRLMWLIGGVEIAAGLLVALKPKVGAYVVALWLAAIIGNLFMRGGYWDIALRDFGLFLGALALGRLAAIYDTHRVHRYARREVLAA